MAEQLGIVFGDIDGDDERVTIEVVTAGGQKFGVIQIEAIQYECLWEAKATATYCRASGESAPAIVSKVAGGACLRSPVALATFAATEPEDLPRPVIVEFSDNTNNEDIDNE